MDYVTVVSKGVSLHMDKTDFCLNLLNIFLFTPQFIKDKRYLSYHKNWDFTILQ